MAKITGNEPAHPFAWKQIEGKDGVKCDIVSSEQKGLTIHQQLTKDFMSAMLSNRHVDSICYGDLKNMALMAIEGSKTLIAELNKEEK